jgi:diaminopimelate decarboxylase
VKPTGPIPSDFQAIGGELAIAGQPVSLLLAQAGDTPLFVYDGSIVRARVAALRAAMPAGLAIHYAIKANPHAGLLALLAGLVDGFDVASAGELARAMAAGPATISFAGPGKRDRELAAAIDAGITINLESEAEADRALRLADAAGKRPALAVRINPDFAITGAGLRMAGGARPFGIDADRVPALVRRLRAAGADWRGFHVFAGSQSLDPQAIAAAQAATVALVGGLAEEVGAAPPVVNLGGGFGIAYFAGDRSLDIGEVGAALGETLAQRPAILADSQFAIELGRWLVGEAGVYLTRVVDRKTSHGETFLVTDGGLHHMLAASGNFGTVVRRNYPIAHAGRFAMPSEELVTVTGCLCTPLDLLGDNVALPHAEVGDVIAIFMAGAYAASASPQAFLGHPPAGELLVDMPQAATS